METKKFFVYSDGGVSGVYMKLSMYDKDIKIVKIDEFSQDCLCLVETTMSRNSIFGVKNINNVSSVPVGVDILITGEAVINR